MKTIQSILYFMVFTVVFAACSDPMDEITNVDYPYAFSPVELAVNPSSFDMATVTWRSVDGAKSYDVVLSLGDSLEFKNIVQRWEGLTGTTLSLTDLWGETQYSIGVVAKAFNEDQQDSRYMTAIEFKTSAEQLFKPVKDIEVKGTKMTVRFELTRGEIDKLAVTPVGGETTYLQLSAEDIEARYKEITDLTPDTEYKIEILNGEQKRGEVITTTQWKPTGSEDNVVMVNAGDDLAAICGDPANIGKVIYLPDGYTFTASTNPGIVLAGTMSIYGDPDAAVKPKLVHSSGGGGNRFISWPDNCNIDEIKLANLQLEGPAHNGNTVFAGRGSGDRIDVLKHIYLERCDVFQFGRCFIRIEGTSHNPIDKITLNNCYFEDIGAYGGVNGNYAFFTVNVGAVAIKEIVVTNSSFRKVYHSFLNAANAANPCNSISIENCTFNDFITGPGATSSRIFIDGNNNKALKINMNGVILGLSGPKSSGYRYGDGSSIAVANTFTTSDYVNETAEQLLPSLVITKIASTTLFKDAEAGDFTIVNNSFEGRNISGDPRWRP